MKDGINTSEFWITATTAVATIGGILADKIPGVAGVIVAGLVAACYTISRGLVKLKGGTPSADEAGLTKIVEGILAKRN